jgi:sugar/nucleoside kinase (ribokinase family)
VPQDDLLTLGEAFEDLIFIDLPRLPGPGEEVKTNSFRKTIGGGAVITAIAAARLGLRCRVMSGLSSEAVSRLRAEKLSVRNLRRSHEHHAITAALSTKRDRSFITYNGINDCLEERLLEPAKRARSKHVHFALYPSRCADWAQVASNLSRRGVTTSWDFGWNEGLLQDDDFLPLVWTLDFVFLNEQEALLYSQRASMRSAIRFWQRHPKTVVMKLGARGSRLISGKARMRSKPLKVQAVDTTGAGDAFNGGFLYALLRGKTLPKCLEMGNRVGALSTQMAGGIDGLPRRADLK